MADLIPFDSLKKVLELEKASLSDYPRLEFIVGGIPGTFEQYTGRKMSEQDKFTESGFIESQTDAIYLTALPLVSVSSLTLDGVAVDPSEYRLDKYGIRFKYRKVHNVEWVVEYTGGFEEWPADLQHAAVIQAAYESQTIDHLGAETITTEGGTTTRPGYKLLPDVVRRLNPYVHVARLI